MALEPAGRFEWERIVRRARIDPTEKYIALLMSTYADPDGTRVRPGTEKLSRVSGKSTRTVIRAITALRDRGLLERTKERQPNGRAGGHDEYRLTFPGDLTESTEMLNPDENE